MKLKTVVLLIFFKSTLAFADGNSLLSNCRVALDLFDKIPNDGSRVGAGMCIGLIQGMREMNTIYSEVPGNHKKLFCPPQKVQTSQLLRLVARYIEMHPADLHEEESFLVLSALYQAYPCP